MKSRTSLVMAMLFALLGACGMAAAEVPTLAEDARPRGTTYLVYELHGGTWHDAEKDYADGGYEDGYMCWAATASNMLAWGGWSDDVGAGDEDAVFEHFQHHWLSVGGDPYWAIVWWFEGGMEESRAHDVPGGGGFHTDLNPRECMRGPHLGTRGVLEALRANAIDGYVSGIRVAHPSVDFWHSVTCWGVNVDPETDKVIGIWVTDSDDDPNGAPPRENYLRYYEVEVIEGRAYVQGYVKGEGTKAYYIDEVLGLPSRAAVAAGGTATQLQPLEPTGRVEPSGQLAAVEPAQAAELPVLRVVLGIAMIVVGAYVVVAMVRSRAKAARS